MKPMFEKFESYLKISTKVFYIAEKVFSLSHREENKRKLSSRSYRWYT